MNTIDTMSQTDHNELCMYLNTWLEQFDVARHKFTSSKLPVAYARLASETLSDLLVIDAQEFGI
jgi:hypothetical protein